MNANEEQMNIYTHTDTHPHTQTYCDAAKHAYLTDKWMV